MMFPSHLLASLALGLLMAKVRSMGPREWALAVGFGVLIDFDHLLQAPVYLATHGVAGLDAATMLGWGANWQGLMHGPWGALAVVGAMVAFRSGIPLVFWGLHMVLDFVVATRFVVFGSPLEWAILGLLALLVLGLLAWEQRAADPPVPFLRHALARFGLEGWRRATERPQGAHEPDEAPASS